MASQHDGSGDATDRSKTLSDYAFALESTMKCPICLFVFTNPVTTPCGHMFCEECIERALRETGNKCPNCSKIVLRSNLKHVYIESLVFVKETGETLNKVLDDTKDVERLVGETNHRLRIKEGELAETGRQLNEEHQCIQQLESQSERLKQQSEELTAKYKETEKAIVAAHKEALKRMTPPTDCHMSLPPSDAFLSGNVISESSSSCIVLAAVDNNSGQNVKVVERSSSTGDSDYCVLERLGTNPLTSRVRRAVVIESEKEVVIKTLRLGKAVAAGYMNNVDCPIVDDPYLLSHAKEAFVLAYIKHPNIITLNSVVISEAPPPWEGKPKGNANSRSYPEGPCLTMELPFMQFDLASALRMRMVHPTDTKVIAMSILNAVSYLHNFGLAHRAVSPLSILVNINPDGQPEVVLAGFSHVITPYGPPLPDNDFPPKSFYSSPDILSSIAARQIISPEQWFAQDIWALGVVALEILTHSGPPFKIPLLHYLGDVFSRELFDDDNVSFPPNMVSNPILRCLKRDGSFANLCGEGMYLNQKDGDGNPLSPEQIEIVERLIEPSLIVPFGKRSTSFELLSGIHGLPPHSFLSKPLEILPLSVPALHAFVNKAVPRL